MNHVVLFVLVIGAFLAGYWVCLFATWNRVFQTEAKIRKLANDINMLKERDDDVPTEWVIDQLDAMVAREFR